MMPKEMSNSPPAKCRCCKTAINAVNGRFCTTYNRYVHYTKDPPCETTVSPTAQA